MTAESPFRFWLLLAIVALIRDLPRTTFSLNMWSAAYPIGAYGFACSQLATDFDSPTFRVVTAIILVVLVLYWLYLFISTLPMLLSGELFLSGAMDEHEEEKMAAREREREREREMRPGSGSSRSEGSSAA